MYANYKLKYDGELPEEDLVKKLLLDFDPDPRVFSIVGQPDILMVDLRNSGGDSSPITPIQYSLILAKGTSAKGFDLRFSGFEHRLNESDWSYLSRLSREEGYQATNITLSLAPKEIDPKRIGKTLDENLTDRTNLASLIGLLGARGYNIQEVNGKNFNYSKEGININVNLESASGFVHIDCKNPDQLSETLKIFDRSGNLPAHSLNLTFERMN